MSARETIDEHKKIRIMALSHELWKIAAPAGSMHAYFDVISDMESFVRGDRTIVQHTADEWIEYAENLLAKQKR